MSKSIKPVRYSLGFKREFPVSPQAKALIDAAWHAARQRRADVEIVAKHSLGLELTTEEQARLNVIHRMAEEDAKYCPECGRPYE